MSRSAHTMSRAHGGSRQRRHAAAGGRGFRPGERGVYHGVAPGARTMERIHRAQRVETGYMLPRTSFARCCRAVTEAFTPLMFPSFRIQEAALEVLQAAVEAHLTTLLEQANLCTIQGRRVKLESRDIQLVRILRGEMSALDALSEG